MMKGFDVNGGEFIRLSLHSRYWKIIMGGEIEERLETRVRHNKKEIMLSLQIISMPLIILGCM